MRVSLQDYTGSGHADPAAWAASQLIFAKSTRLNMSPGLLEEIQSWPAERREAELAYIANTIPASHEFVHYTFMIEGVSRGFTHQFVRSRTWSFAQQTMRVLNMETWDYATGPTILADDKRNTLYRKTMRDIDRAYKKLIEMGAAVEDARGVLPTNILTNIEASCNLPTFVELVRKRSGPRVQGEYRSVLEAMQAAVLQVHPWAALFIDRTFDRAAQDLDKEIAALPDKAQATRMMKLVDQMRQPQ